MAIQQPSIRDRLQFVFAPKDSRGVGFFDRLVLGLMLGAEGAWTARRDDPKEKQVLEALEALSKERGIATPKLIVYKSDIPNAASIASGNVVIGTNLMEIMTPPQIKAVLGHELSHHRHRVRDMPTMLAIPLAYDMGRQVVFNKMGNSKLSTEGKIAFAAVDGVGLVVSNIGVPLAYMRSCEYEADKEGAELTKPQDMIGALQSLDRRVRQIQQERAPKNQFAKPRKQPGWMHWLSSHPPTASRVERLKQMEEHPVADQEMLPINTVSR